MKTERRITERFEATDDQGRTYSVVEYCDFVRHHTSGGSEWDSGGLPAYMLANGDPVFWNPDGTFTLVRTGAVLTRRKL